MGDAGDHPLHQADVAGIVEGTEPQRIEQGDRPGAHGEDVPQDAADARGSPLKRLDRRGVVVAFDLEGQPLPLAQIDHTGVFTGADQDAGPAGGEARQQRPAVAVAAVLGPHDAEHAQFGPVGGPAQAPADLVVISAAEVLLLQSRVQGIVGLGRRRRHGGEASALQYQIQGSSSATGADRRGGR